MFKGIVTRDILAPVFFYRSSIWRLDFEANPIVFFRILEVVQILQ
jgi:hypothetical protein